MRPSSKTARSGCGVCQLKLSQVRAGHSSLKPNPLVAEQTRLVQELRSLAGDRRALAALLKHPDPKVRTLALGALFQREDGRDLPLLAGLIEDPALTFPTCTIPCPKRAARAP